MTAPEHGDTLVRFYKKVRPQITGWKPVAKIAGDETVTRDLGRNLISWLLGCVMVYTMLACIGALCFGRYSSAGVFGAVAGVLPRGLVHSIHQPPQICPHTCRYR